MLIYLFIYNMIKEKFILIKKEGIEGFEPLRIKMMTMWYVSIGYLIFTTISLNWVYMIIYKS